MTIEAVVDPRVANWVIDGIAGADLDDIGQNYVAIGFTRNKKPIGGVVFVEYNPKIKTCNLLVRSASRMFMKPEVLRHVFGTAFNNIGVDCIRVGVREGNKASEKVIRHIGFRKEGVHRRAWDGKTNMITFSLLKSECKYLDE